MLTNTTHKFISTLLQVGVVVCLFLMMDRHGKSKGVQYSDTIKTTIVDTVEYYVPVPKDSTVLKYVTVRLPVADSTVTEDSAKTDSANVDVPITQKVYGDSAYTAYVSGYNAHLDSIFLYPRTEIHLITEKPKRKRWGIGIQAGYGVTVSKTPELRPYVGIGISYNLFTF